jgi:hypothetical protein
VATCIPVSRSARLISLLFPTKYYGTIIIFMVQTVTFTMRISKRTICMTRKDFVMFQFHWSHVDSWVSPNLLCPMVLFLVGPGKGRLHHLHM